MSQMSDQRSLWPVVVAIGLAAAMLLFGYEFIRASSTSLYIAAYGSDRLPYAMLAGTVLTLGALYVYGWVLSLLGPRRTLAVVSLLSGLLILAGYLALGAGSRAAALFVYALREAYVVLLVEQYWSFINSTFKDAQARRFNGVICGIASIGAISGGYATRALTSPAGPLYIGTEGLLILAAASLAPAALFAEAAYRLAARAGTRPPEAAAHRSLLALGLFRESAHLRRLALVVVLTQAVSTALDLGFFSLVEAALPVKDARTAYIGAFYGRLNMVAAALQFVAAPVLLSRLPLRLVLTAIPVVHLAASGALLVRPSLGTAGAAFLLFKALDYSLFRAGKETFYIPLSFDVRYRAKEVIDALGYRASKGLCAALASAARGLAGALPLAVYPLSAMAAAAAWLVATKHLVRRHEEILAPPPADRLG